MNMNQNTPQFNLPFVAAPSAPLTMSSREIADLCEKRHAHVLRDIEQMIQDIGEPKFGLADLEGEYLDIQGKPRKEYRLPKDLTVTLITGYRADLRYKVVKRLEEMEARATQPALPDFSDPVAAARAWADALERKQAAEARMIETQRIVADLAPKAEAYDRLDSLEGSLNVRAATKVLGIQEHKLIKWLQLNRWAFRQSGKGPLQAYVEKINTGYLDHRLSDYTNSHGEKRVSITLMITPKGMKRIAYLLSKEGGAA